MRMLMESDQQQFFRWDERAKLLTYMRGKSILVTGGTGSFGKTFIRHALAELEPVRVAVFSRDELSN